MSSLIESYIVTAARVLYVQSAKGFPRGGLGVDKPSHTTGTCQRVSSNVSARINRINKYLSNHDSNLYLWMLLYLMVYCGTIFDALFVISWPPWDWSDAILLVSFIFKNIGFIVVLLWYCLTSVLKVNAVSTVSWYLKKRHGWVSWSGSTLQLRFDAIFKNLDLLFSFILKWASYFLWQLFVWLGLNV